MEQLNAELREIIKPGDGRLKGFSSGTRPVSIGSFNEAYVNYGFSSGRYSQVAGWRLLSFAPAALRNPGAPDEAHVDYGLQYTWDMLGLGGGLIVLLGSVPEGFRKWLTDGIRLFFGVGSTLSVAGTLTVSVDVIDPLATEGIIASDSIAFDVLTLPAGGNYPQKLQLTAEDLGTDWKPGYPLLLQFSWQLTIGGGVPAGEQLFLFMGPLYYDWAT